MATIRGIKAQRYYRQDVKFPLSCDDWSNMARKARLFALLLPSLASAAPATVPGEALLEVNFNSYTTPRVTLLIGSDSDPGDLLTALRRATGCSLPRGIHPTFADHETKVDVACGETLPLSDGLVSVELLRPEYLRSALSSVGIRKLTIAVRHLEAPVGEAPRLTNTLREDGEIVHQADFDLASPLPEVSFRVGYRWRDLRSFGTGLTLILAFSALIAMWVRSMPGLPGRQAELKFWGTAALAVAWLELARGTGLYGLFWFLSRTPNHSVTRGALAVGFCAVLSLLLSISSPRITKAFRGVHCERPLPRRVAAGLVYNVLFAIGLQEGLDLLMAGHRIPGIVVTLLSLACLTKSIAGSRRALRGVSIQSGELFEKARDLIRRAGVSPFRVSARNGNNNLAGQVVIPDKVFDNLPRDEMDAYLAHGFGHLSDAKGMVAGLVGSFIVFVIVLRAVLSNWSLISWNVVVASLSLTPLLYAVWIRVRIAHAERKANRKAVEIRGGDARPLIRAIARLNKIEYGFVPESETRRLREIAVMSGLPEESASAMLSELQTVPPDARYPRSPIDANAAQESLFSKKRKDKRSAWNLAITMLALFTPLIAAMKIASSMKLESAGLIVLYVLALAVSAVVGILCEAYLSVIELPKVKRELAAKLRAEGIDVAQLHGHYVGLSPHAYEASYDGWAEWDVGFAFLFRDSLCYVGAQTRFHLQRDDIERIELIPVRRKWWDNAEILVAFDRGRIIRFTAVDVTVAWQQARQARRLFEEFRQWQLGSVGTSEPGGMWADLSTPPSWRDVAHEKVSSGKLRRGLPALVIIGAVASAAIGFIAGLPFEPEKPGSAWHLLPIAFCAMVLMMPRLFRRA
jgi:hypothetical protein